MFGFPSSRHIMKIAPFTMRLVYATQALLKAIQANDQMEMARGIEDVGFWTARTTSELISGEEEGEENLDIYKKAMHALFEAQRVSVRARKQIGGKTGYGAIDNPSPAGALWSMAGIISGPLLVYAAPQLEPKWLSHAVSLIGLGIVGLQVHRKWRASKSEVEDKVLSTETALVPYSKLEDKTSESAMKFANIPAFGALVPTNATITIDRAENGAPDSVLCRLR